MEKPFSIGDWVMTPSVEGTVEDISFRSTRFRTFAQALVTVPNSTLANEAITNWSRMGKRRVSFYLGLNYLTSPDKIEIAVDKITQLLKSESTIHGDNVLVSFENFQESSLDILVQYFTRTTVLGREFKGKGRNQSENHAAFTDGRDLHGLSQSQYLYRKRRIYQLAMLSLFK
jgi:MscS family membrane protein